MAWCLCAVETIAARADIPVLVLLIAQRRVACVAQVLLPGARLRRARGLLRGGGLCAPHLRLLHVRARGAVMLLTSILPRWLGFLIVIGGP